MDRFAHKDRSPRKEKNFIYGIRPIQEAIAAEKVFDKVWVAEGDLSPTMKDILFALRKKGVIWKQVDFHKLSSMVGGNHQGIVASISAIEFTELEEVISRAYEAGEDPFILLLDGITDVRNFGAIARTAACAGVHGIAVPAKGGAAINADAVKTSAGALLTLPVCRFVSVYNAIKMMKSAGLKIAGASEKGSDILYKADLSGPLAIILGDEETGISTEAWKLCDTQFKIPLHQKGVESLNVSVAAGISMFEVLRQRLAE